MVPALAVGAAGIPVNVGEFRSAFPEMSIVFHETTAPSVLRNFPALPVCDGYGFIVAGDRTTHWLPSQTLAIFAIV